MIELPDDFRGLLLALCDAGAEFVVVGGHAVAFHGHPRATKDLRWGPSAHRCPLSKSVKATSPATTACCRSEFHPCASTSSTAPTASPSTRRSRMVPASRSMAAPFPSSGGRRCSRTNVHPAETRISPTSGSSSASLPRAAARQSDLDKMRADLRLGRHGHGTREVGDLVAKLVS